MPLVRQNQNQPSSKPKPEREPHECVPIKGEFGRYYVKSRSAAKAGLDEAYTVDVLAKEQTDSHGEVVGTCPCKGWQVRKTCTHLDDARIKHETVVAKQAAEAIGFKNLEGEASSD
jgi:hypothetical protein